ncbi:hypothetical protein [Segetibacter sp.]|jgi:hypothetical protein|uniref:hypothetical protein n=1 Tax=Segetibacter sp. TaxID=2231182 RepID=UPI00260DB038|nr:hypothetical protein [Segetibacter sp.]MCW3082182.1 hypothetical protein [Segetibacter sp.]
MAYIQSGEFVYDCSKCHTRCDGISKGVYIFDNDVSFSEYYEKIIIKHINSYEKYTSSKCTTDGFPDIEIKNKEGEVYRFLEVKVQQRTFMNIEKYLPGSKLAPSETVALNLSDLLRYFTIEETTGVNTVITWVLLNRLCIVPKNSFRLFYQSSSELKRIYEVEKMHRTFRRKSGDGDIVDGVHKGVTVNFHFSLKELIEWKWPVSQ